MKTKTTIKQTLLALTIALSIVSCKKDKKEDPTPPPVEVKAMTFTELKALSTGASVKVPDAKKITGIVISDVSAKNIDGKTVVLQDAASQTGIIVTFDAAQTFAVNDQVEVTISNQTLAQVNGEIVLQNVPAANAKKTGTGTVAAKATTATDIVTNKTAWDGTLVTLSEGSFSGGNGDGKYAGNLIYTDAAGAIKSNILAGAAFAGTAYPVAVNTVTGIVRVNGTDVSVDIRNAGDVAASTSITRTITDDFSTYQKGGDGNYQTQLLGVIYPSSGPGGDGNVFLRTPLQGDESFLQTTKSYLYLDNVGPVANVLIGDASTIKGFKQVSITLAASKFVGQIGGSTQKVVSAFDPTTQTNGVAIYLYTDDYSGRFKVANLSFKDVGVSHSFTWKFPATEAELEAMMISQGENADRAKNYAPVLFSSTKNIIEIDNSSSLRNGNPNTAEIDYQPIILQKLVFGFDK